MSLESILSQLSVVPFLIAAIFALGFSIFIHELGHFLAARKRGLKVTRFSIGMGPKIVSWNRNGVDYRLSWLPLGGYVALPQLADMGRVEGGNPETQADGNKVERLPPISFWDKIIVASAGAFFNFVFAFLIACLLWWTGQPAVEDMLTNQVGYVHRSMQVNGSAMPGPAHEAGIRPGDRILRIDGKPVADFRDIQQMILTGMDRDSDSNPRVILEIEREGETLTVPVTPLLTVFNASSGDTIRTIGIQPAHRLILRNVSKNSPGERAGLQADDQLLSANGLPLYRLQALIDTLIARPGQAVDLEILREDKRFNITLIPETVAISKPVLQINIDRDGGPASRITIRPDWPEGVEPQIDPKADAALIVHDIDPHNSELTRTIQHEDRIIAINGKAVESLDGLNRAIASLEGSSVLQLTVGRNQHTQAIPVVFSGISSEIKGPATQPMVGFHLRENRTLTRVDPFTQFIRQIDITFRILKALFHPGSDISVGHLSGPVGIVRVLSDLTQVDIRLLLAFLVLMNVNLGILNLLPIPVLDGGHILFAIVGRLRGKAIPVRIVASLQAAFMLMLFSLIIFVIIKDSMRWHGDVHEGNTMERQSKLFIQPKFIEQPEAPDPLLPAETFGSVTQP